MNRIQNHIEGGISDVYDQHEYAEENKHVMETVASKIMSLVEGASSARSFLSGRARRDCATEGTIRSISKKHGVSEPVRPHGPHARLDNSARLSHDAEPYCCE
jgi:hypothetical protein